MKNHNGVVVEKLPSGLRMRSGGTRRLTRQRLSRVWQKEDTTPEVCPLCATQEALVRSFPGWKVFRNPSTIYEEHLLLVPEECSCDLTSVCDHWLKEATVLELASCLMTARDTWLGIQVGGLAGGSVRHAHYHLLEPNGDSKVVSRTARFFGHAYPLVFRMGSCAVVAGGSRAGQCLLLQLDERKDLQETDVALAITRLLRLFAEKFRSVQGLPPEYQVGVAFSDGKIRYATAIPILAQPGFGDNLALLEGRELPLGWPHAETARFLRDEGE